MILFILLLFIGGCSIINGLKQDDSVIYYSVSFDTNGGSSIKSQNVQDGKYIEMPEIPVKEGYIFDGWMYNGEKFDFLFSY